MCSWTPSFAYSKRWCRRFESPLSTFFLFSFLSLQALNFALNSTSSWLNSALNDITKRCKGLLLSSWAYQLIEEMRIVSSIAKNVTENQATSNFWIPEKKVGWMPLLAGASLCMPKIVDPPPPPPKKKRTNKHEKCLAVVNYRGFYRLGQFLTSSWLEPILSQDILTINQAQVTSFIP